MQFRMRVQDGHGYSSVLKHNRPVCRKAVQLCDEIVASPVDLMPLMTAECHALPKHDSAQDDHQNLKTRTTAGQKDREDGPESQDSWHRVTCHQGRLHRLGKQHNHQRHQRQKQAWGKLSGQFADGLNCVRRRTVFYDRQIDVLFT